MSKAAELAALIGSQSALSNRNLIINGAVQVAGILQQIDGKYLQLVLMEGLLNRKHR